MNQFQKAERSKCKIKMAIQGPSGSGKTYSSLLVAHGLIGDWKKIAVIDTENGSSHLYSKLGEYSVLSLTPPFSPEKYIDAIELAVKEGFECLIIDSLSHEWNGQGGILDIHSNIPGNSFTAWAKVTPRHNACLQSILNSDIHIIATMRSKTDYVVNEKNGKQIPEKIGLKATQREDSEYEFTIVFELNQLHVASVSKDRTNLFRAISQLKLTSDTGEIIKDWCEGPDAKPEDTQSSYFKSLIDDCKTMLELITLYTNNEDKHAEYKEDFINRKQQITNETKHLSNGQQI